MARYQSMPPPCAWSPAQPKCTIAPHQAVVISYANLMPTCEEKGTTIRALLDGPSAIILELGEFEATSSPTDQDDALWAKWVPEKPRER